MIVYSPLFLTAFTLTPLVHICCAPLWEMLLVSLLPCVPRLLVSVLWVRDLDYWLLMIPSFYYVIPLPFPSSYTSFGLLPVFSHVFFMSMTPLSVLLLVVSVMCPCLLLTRPGFRLVSLSVQVVWDSGVRYSCLLGLCCGIPSCVLCYPGCVFSSRSRGCSWSLVSYPGWCSSIWWGYRYPESLGFPPGFCCLHLLVW